MSRATVRSATASWVTGVTGVSKVYASFPKQIPAQDWATSPPTASSAVLVVFIDAEQESRGSEGGTVVNGWKRVDYQVSLHIFHRSTEPTTEAAMTSFDAVLEALRVKLRSDHTFGGAVWQAAEPTIRGEYGEPAVSGDITETWGQLSFVVTEWLNA